MGARFAADPNVVFDFFFCRWTQIEIDARIQSSRFYRDRGFHCATCRQIHLVEPSRHFSREMAVGVRAADNRRDLSAYLFKPDFSVSERAAIRAHDISLDQGSLR